MNLDDMIAAERSAPAEATNTQTADVWRSIEHSCVSIAPPAGAALTATKTTTLAKLGGALSTATGKVLLVAALGTAGLIGANDLGTSHEDLSAAEPAVSRVETTPPTAALPTRPGPRVAEIAIEPEPEPSQRQSQRQSQSPAAFASKALAPFWRRRRHLPSKGRGPRLPPHPRQSPRFKRNSRSSDAPRPPCAWATMRAR